MTQGWAVVDLFSGAGGMSCGFSRRPEFEVIGAADAQLGKPSAAAGSLGCNASYAANIGLLPVAADLAAAEPAEVCQAMGLSGRPIAVLAACPPCTGFSRAVASNHLRDDHRNGLVGRVAEYAALLRPDIVLLENARELVTGRFGGHLRDLLGQLGRLGYHAAARTHFLNEFGLPQRRERAIVVAVRRELALRDLPSLWQGWRVDAKATHVRRAIWDLPPVLAGQRDPDPIRCTSRPPSGRRSTGGGWPQCHPTAAAGLELINRPDGSDLLTPAMAGRVARADWAAIPTSTGGCGGTGRPLPSSANAATSGTAVTRTRSRTGCARSERCRSCRAFRVTTSSPARSRTCTGTSATPCRR